VTGAMENQSLVKRTDQIKVAVMSLPKEISPPQQSLVNTFLFIFTNGALS
jgi:hypothetical protein